MLDIIIGHCQTCFCKFDFLMFSQFSFLNQLFSWFKRSVWFFMSITVHTFLWKIGNWKYHFMSIRVIFHHYSMKHTYQMILSKVPLIMKHSTADHFVEKSLHTHFRCFCSRHYPKKMSWHEVSSRIIKKPIKKQLILPTTIMAFKNSNSLLWMICPKATTTWMLARCRSRAISSDSQSCNKQFSSDAI